MIKEVWANYRDESFILQFLSPAIMRQFRMFTLLDDAEESHYLVTSIHDEQGFQKVREALAANYDMASNEPDIQIVDVDLLGDRQLRLECNTHNESVLDEKDRDSVLAHIEQLWGYDVVIDEFLKN